MNHAKLSLWDFTANCVGPQFCTWCFSLGAREAEAIPGNPTWDGRNPKIAGLTQPCSCKRAAWRRASRPIRTADFNPSQHRAWAENAVMFERSWFLVRLHLWAFGTPKLMQFVKLHLWKWSPIGLEFQTWTTLRLVFSCCQPSRASQRVDVSQMQPSIHAFFSDFGHWCQKPHQSPNVGPDVVSYHIYHYVTRPTSVEKEHSFQVHFMFRVEPGRKIWVDGDLANCLALRVHLQVLCWISEYSEQRRGDKMSRNQKTWKRSRIAVFCWATGIGGKASFVKVEMEVESFRSRVTSIIAFCRLQALKICHYIVSLWAGNLQPSQAVILHNLRPLSSWCSWSI